MFYRTRATLKIGIVAVFTMTLCGCEKQMTRPGEMPSYLEVRSTAIRTYSGGQLPLTAVAAYPDGTQRDVTVEVEWSVSPGQAGYMTDDGMFHALKDAAGVEIVHADYAGHQDTIRIEVEWGAQSLLVWPVTAAVAAGGTVQFQAIAKYYGSYANYAQSKEYVTHETIWSVEPEGSGTIDRSGLFRSNPGFQGVGIITGTYHALSAVGEAEVMESYESPFEMVMIPAGTYWMGDEDGRPGEKPAHEIFIDDFYIGTKEVTNAQYAAYLNQALQAGEIMVSSTIISGTRGPFAHMIYGRLRGNPNFPDVFIEYTETREGEPVFVVQTGFEDFPVVRLNWSGAAAFCAFYGLRLPTEAEWEKACRGNAQLAFGTANGSIDHDLANYAGVGGNDSYEGLAPVGSFQPNPYGLYDMCGNAAEYVFDMYDVNYYAVSPAVNPFGPGPLYPSELEPGAPLVYRGGAWLFSADFCRSSFRGVIELQEDTSVACYFGFRVAKSVE